jgi:hypothetical protein
MKKAFAASLMALALMFMPAVVPIPVLLAHPVMLAQQVPESRTSTVNLTVEQRHVIKEIVKDLGVAKVSEDAKVTTGSAAPSEAVLRFFPQDITDKVPQIKSHKFFVQGSHIVIVSPDGNNVVDIIE